MNAFAWSNSVEKMDLSPFFASFILKRHNFFFICIICLYIKIDETFLLACLSFASARVIAQVFTPDSCISPSNHLVSLNYPDADLQYEFIRTFFELCICFGKYIRILEGNILI